MSIRQLHIDGQLAEQGEDLAEYLGYPDLEHYVMALLSRDIEQKTDIVRMTHSVMDEREQEEDES